MNYCGRYSCPCTPGVQEIDPLFDALDQGLLQGVSPEQLLRVACQTVSVLFRYPLVVLKSFPGEGRESLQVAAGGRAEPRTPLSEKETNGSDWTAEGITGALVLPVRNNGRLVATLQVLTQAENGFAAAEIETLDALARRIAMVFLISAGQHQLRLLGAALSSAVNSVFITDDKGHIEWVNSAFMRMTGYSEPEVIGQDPRILKSDVHDAAFFAEIWRTISAGKAWEGEVVERHKDGHHYVVHQTITPILTDGRVTHYVAIHEDITARKQLETELREARDRALGAARLQSEFLANMSHEVRTPMNGVLGMLELMADTELTPQQRHYLEVARRSAKVLLDSLSDILDYSRLGAVGLKLNPTDTDLSGLLDEAVDMVAGAAGDKGLEVYARIDEDVPMLVRLDPVRLRQVLLNLVGNAIKFTDRGEVDIRVMREWAEPGQLRFEVQDTGVGIPVEARERIFEPFQQVDGSSTRRFGGSGLGLAICRQIVAGMGGEIGVVSEPGAGSLFWFTVPFEAALARGHQAQSAVAGVRVLLVEPRAAQRDVLKRLARRLGLELTVVGSGLEARQARRDAEQSARPIQIAIVGERLPDLDPMALHQELAAAGVHVVALVAPGEGCPSWGDGNCLRRPLSTVQVERCLRMALQGRAAERHPEAVTEGGRILVVEDNPVNQQVAAAMLTRLGFDCVLAGDGAQALERLQQERFDVVLMDCQMPVMDGYEAAGRMRRRERELGLAPIPIVAMTADARPEEAERCAAAEMDGYLPKPLELQLLREALARFLLNPRQQPLPLEQPRREVLDGRALAQLREVDAEDAARIIDAFLGDMPPRLAGLRESLGDRDWRRGAQIAHAIKGSGTALGVQALVRACAELEARCKAGDPGAVSLLNEADEAFQTAVGPLLAFRERLMAEAVGQR